LTFGRKKSKSDACTGIGFFMRLALALELTHNIASTPNAIVGLDSLLDPSLVEQALEQAGVATPTQAAFAAGNDALVRDLHGLFSTHVGLGCGQHYIPLIERKPGALRNGAPFADLLKPLLPLKRGLRRHSNCDRVMTEVLAAVPHICPSARAVEPCYFTCCPGCDHGVAGSADTPLPHRRNGQRVLTPTTQQLGRPDEDQIT
jgi:hypothetical protein